MYIATELICITVEIIMVHLYLSYSLKKKRKTLTVILSNLLCFAGLTVLSFLDNMAFARLLFTFLAIFFISVIVYKAGIIQGLLHSFIFCTFIIVADIITSITFLICNINTEQLLKLGSGRSLYIIIGHIVLFISFLILLSVRPLLKIPYSLKEFMCTLPCIMITGLLCYILTTQYIFKGIEIPGLYIIVLLGMLYTNVFFLFFIHSFHTRTMEKQEYELARQHFLIQQEYYEQLHNRQESIRALWHDLNKYIAASRIEGSNSLSELQNQLNEINSAIDTNNRIINVILNEYMHQAKQIEADVEFDISVPDTLPMIATDLYIVLGNSFDNALDAISTIDVPMRKINMKLKFQNNILFYELTNPYVEGITKPKQKLVHGYGIRNIRKVAEKYNGIVLINKNDNIFSISAHFNF